jgi:plasmid maintenance system antidote protein VapI
MAEFENPSVQSEFFNQIRANLPSNITLVDAIADFLGISNDSAYRRIRDDTPISFEEIGKLSRHFGVSVDKLLNLKADAYIFTGKLANTQDHILDKWLKNVLGQFNFMCDYPNCNLFYLAKDLPTRQSSMA